MRARRRHICLAGLGTAAFLAAQALAEGRTDAFLGCTFDDTEITLAEDGEAVVWQQAGTTYDAACFGQGGWAVVCVADSVPPRLLTLATDSGAALLTEPDRTGGLTHSEKRGQCQSLIP